MRIGIIARPALIAAAALVALGAPAAEAKPRVFAYGFLMNGSGTWLGPRLPDRTPDLSIVDQIIAANPSHLRVTVASHRPEEMLQPADEYTAEAYERLTAAGIKLGAALTVKRPPEEVIAQGCAIREAGDWYHWLFLDFASLSAGHLGDLIRALRACGWEQVIVNASGGRAGFPRAAYAAAKRMDVVGSPQRWKYWRKRARRIARGKAPALHNKDRTWVRRARNRGTRPILKLEVPWQTGNMFSRLSTRTQRIVLRKWHKAVRRLGADFIYPLYVHRAFALSPYDSRVERTLGLQTKLMRSAANKGGNR